MPVAIETVSCLGQSSVGVSVTFCGVHQMGEGVLLDQESLNILEMVACHQEVNSLVVRKKKGVLVGGWGTWSWLVKMARS